MKRVSIEVGKALKKVGYPIEVKLIDEAEKLGWKKGEVFFTGMCTCALCPFAMDVWLWLLQNKSFMRDFESKFDTEEAIIEEIKYLADNNFKRI